MNALDNARVLKRAGLVAEALRVLLEIKALNRDRVSADVLRAELLQINGQFESARTLVAKLLKSAELNQEQRGTYEYILCERRDEIPAFVNRFVADAAAEFGKGHLTVTEETIELLILYRWPGNVSQLPNEIRRIVALAEPKSVIGPEAVDDKINGSMQVLPSAGINSHELSVSLQAQLLPTVARIECEMIKSALIRHHGRPTATARALGISRKGLYLKRQRFGICGR